MRYQKLARVMAVPGLALTMAAGPAMAATAQAAPAAPAAQTAVKQTNAADTQAAAVRRMSKKCVKPVGKRFNVSFSPGKQSTTFYFNNHCSHRSYIKVRIYTTGKPNYQNKCIRVNAKTKGSKKIWHVGGRWVSTTLVKC